MQNTDSMIKVAVIWRGNKYVVEIDSIASIKVLGDELKKLTGVKADTMKLIVPQFSGKTSKLLSPFSDEHSGLSLKESSIVEGKSVRMMGVSEDDVDKVLQSAKVDMRIAGFDVEEKRMSAGFPAMFKLPQGPYIFRDFRTLEIPGIELNTRASEALKRMHMLASDHGIVAIMNKLRWQVGIMTEMAPVGYVGVSPKCILGLNKNHGEEIFLRLRTGELKRFRKYESIKKTLLHELAQMVCSNHDANFYALDKQLNQEARRLDCTRSRGHLNVEFDIPDNKSFSQKIRENASDQLASACASSVAAAYHCLANASVSRPGGSEVHEEPDPDDSRFYEQDKHDFTDAEGDSMATEIPDENQLKADDEPDPDDHSCDPYKFEPDPDDSQGNHSQVMGILNGWVHLSKIVDECNPNDLGHKQDKVEKGVSEKLAEDAHLPFERMEEQEHLEKDNAEPDPDESHENKGEPDPDESCENKGEPDPDESHENKGEPDPDESCEYKGEPGPDESHENKGEPDPDESRANNKPDEHLASSLQAKHKPYEDLVSSRGVSSMQINEPDPDDQELQRIQDPVTFVCERLQKATELLRAEVNTAEAMAALQTLFKIIGNTIEHPDEVKYKRLKKLQWKSCRQLDLAKMLCSMNLGSLKLARC